MFGSGGRALARPALVAITIGLVALASLGGGRGGRSLAQEGEATPVAVDFGQLVGERPAEIVSGSCAEPGEPVAQLTALEIPEGEAQGQGAAIEAERSYTSLPLDLQALLDGPYSVSILLSDEESDLAIACGEIGGVPSDGGAIVVKLSPRNDSGFSGIAFLAPEGAGATGASLFVAGERTVGETRELIDLDCVSRRQIGRGDAAVDDAVAAEQGLPA